MCMPDVVNDVSYKELFNANWHKWTRIAGRKVGVLRIYPFKPLEPLCHQEDRPSDEPFLSPTFAFSPFYELHFHVGNFSEIQFIRTIAPGSKLDSIWNFQLLYFDKGKKTQKCEQCGACQLHAGRQAAKVNVNLAPTPEEFLALSRRCSLNP